MFGSNQGKNTVGVQIEEMDPRVVQRIKETSCLEKLLSEVDMEVRKCDFYASNCKEEQLSRFFKLEVKRLNVFRTALNERFESMTKG